MFKCEKCEREFKTKQALGSHWGFCRPDAKDRKGKNSPNFGRKGKNQYTNLDWDSIPFDQLKGAQKRLRLLNEANHQCTQCGFSKTRENGASILEIDHIDGNHTNNTKENLRVLCPNCHALTPNFRNWGRPKGQRTSTRFRKGNKGYEEFAKERREERLESQRKRLIEFEQMQTRVDNKKQEDLKNLQKLRESKIDFTKFGWIGKASKIIEVCPQHTREWIQKMDPDLLKNVHCRRSRNG